MFKPLIGINLDIKDKERDDVPHAQIASPYFDAITKAGGIPVLIPPMPDRQLKQLLKQLGGVLLIGGNDYSPELYGEEQHDAVKRVHAVREEFDLRLAALLLRRKDISVLGICGGCQLLNIAGGGTLIQDIPTQFGTSEIHHRRGDQIPRHAAVLEVDTLVRGIYRRRTISVITSHHQAVKDVAPGFIASAHAPDGIIESIENPSRRFLLGVQWHPERDFEGSASLFRAFIRSAKR
jgi:gamma-glutamyl-gamma-aminobutyrate hydrolase PuuD